MLEAAWLQQLSPGVTLVARPQESPADLTLGGSAMTMMDERAMAETGVDGSGPLAVPEGAQDVEVETTADGKLVVRWNGSLYSDSDEPDRWEVTLSADGRTIHFRVEVEGGPAWLGDIEVVIRWVTRYHSGIYVHLCIGWSENILAA